MSDVELGEQESREEISLLDPKNEMKSKFNDLEGLRKQTQEQIQRTRSDAS